MISIGMILALILLLFIFVRTCSYGIWIWKTENRTGALMVFVIALAAIVLPVYKLFSNN